MKIEDYIQEHREEFDDIKIGDSDIQQFTKRLKRQKRDRLFRIYSYAIAAAAAVVIAVLVSRVEINRGEVMDNDLIHITAQYNNSISEMIERLKEVSSYLPKEQQEQLLKDIEKMQQENIQFVNEINDINIDMQREIMRERYMIQKYNIDNITELVITNRR